MPNKQNAAYQKANRTNLMIEREPVRLIDALAMELIIYWELVVPKALRLPEGAHYKLQ